MPKLHKVLKVFQYIFDPGYRFIKDSRRGKYDHLSDEEYLKRKFTYCFKRELNLDSPKSFNEKLQWLKLYARNPEYTVMVDKLAVKKYVEVRIGAEYIIPTLGVWDKFEDIDFDALPEQFVLKCTHDSGGLVICKDKSKLDINKANKRISGSMRRDFYMRSREWPYKNVTRKIIAEQYMKDEKSDDLRDYKFYCFNGKPEFLYLSEALADHSKARISFVSMDWEKMPFKRNDYANFEVLPERPVNFDLMIELCNKLSANIPFLRVDLYEINGKVYFGELTFFPGSGFTPLVPEEWDYKIGEWLELPKEKICQS